MNGSASEIDLQEQHGQTMEMKTKHQTSNTAGKRPFVLFDLGGVLADINVSAATEYWESKTGVTIATWEERLFRSGLKEEMDKGRVSTAEVVAQLAASTSMTNELFREGWEKVLKARPRMSDLVSQVSRKIPCGLLSNTDPIHHEWANSNIPGLSDMSVQFVSYEEGCWKPEPKFYSQILASLNHPPGEVFFVDDLQRNVDGATQAGMDAVLFTSERELKNVLSSRFSELDFLRMEP